MIIAPKFSNSPVFFTFLKITRERNLAKIFWVKIGVIFLFVSVLVLFFPGRVERATVPGKISPPLIKRTPRGEVKGIHLTSWVVGNSHLFRKILNRVKKSEIDCLVIDIKEADGVVCFETRNSLAKRIGAVERRIPNLKKIISLCIQLRLYKIARIVVFKDPVLSAACPELGIRTKRGELWQDEVGCYWTNPYLLEVWEYNIALGEEVLKLGFDEVQLDYVRFPDKGDLEDCYFGEDLGFESKEEAITEFVKLASWRLRPLGFLSADVFGATTPGEDIGIGQNFQALAQHLDYISPMVYPSHYVKGSYGLDNPVFSPYQIVFLALQDALEKVKGTSCQIRPWLQDFSLKYRYGEFEVLAQIKAVYENGLKSWLLWNPRCCYTWRILEKNTERMTPSLHIHPLIRREKSEFEPNN